MANIQQVKEAVNKTQIVTVDEFLKKNSKMIRSALQNTITPDRFLAITQIVMQSPALQGCTQDSLIGAVLQTIQIGLTPGAIGHVHYVPFWNNRKKVREVQTMIGYKGFVELVNRSREASILTAEVVFANDQFQYEQGLNPILRHIPADGDRGEMIGVYCIAKNMLANEKVFVFVPKSEVEKIRNEALSKIEPDRQKYSPWVKWEKEMWQKTAVRRVVKLLPLSTEVQQKISADDTVKVNISEKMVDSPNKADWNSAVEAEVLPEAEKEAVPDAPEAQGSDVSRETSQAAPQLKDALVGAIVSEFRGLVVGLTVKDVKIKGKPGQVTLYMAEDEDGTRYEIGKFGSPKDNVENAICIFKGIAVSEYNGKIQYLAKEIEVLDVEQG
jgi:recombination protein RecT